jgi:hypothetical protein
MYTGSSMTRDHQNTLKSSELKEYITCIASRYNPKLLNGMTVNEVFTAAGIDHTE